MHTICKLSLHSIPFPAASGARFPRGNQILWILAPAERAGVTGIVLLDVTLDRADKFARRIEDCILQPLPRRFREDALDRVHTGCRGRGEVKRPVGMVRQPFMNLGRFVGIDVTLIGMNRHRGPDPASNMIEEGGEFLRAVPLHGSVAMSSAAIRRQVPLRLESCVRVSGCPGFIGNDRWKTSGSASSRLPK